MDAQLEAAIDRRVHQGPLAWLVSRQTFWVFFAAVVACVALSLATDTFATERNLFNVTRNFAFVGIVAIGMTAVIITAGIDLSVGSVVVLAGMVAGMTMNAGWSIWIGATLAIATALLVGFVNGVLIAYVGMPPFVVTLGMLSLGAQPRDGAFRQQDGLRVRPRPRHAAVARRRLDPRHPEPA